MGTLDDAVGEPVDFLKIDVEGMQEDVLLGATRLLENRPVVWVEVRDWLDERAPVERILGGMDYEARRIN